MEVLFTLYERATSVLEYKILIVPILLQEYTFGPSFREIQNNDMLFEWF